MPPSYGATRVVVVCLLAAAALPACSTSTSSDAAPPEPTSSATSPTPGDDGSSTSSPTATTTAPTAGRDLDVDELVMRPASKKLPRAWHEVFVIGYGPGKELLGTSPGGDSGSLDLGPEFGAPAADGTWWFLDPAKRRLAHFDANGAFLDEVKVSDQLLVDGTYFQWQLPHVLADGTLVAARQDGQRTWLLRLRDGVLDEIPVDGSFAALYDDGQRLYGFAGRRKVLVVDPTDGSVERTDVYRTPSGTPFTISVEDGLNVELPDSGTGKNLPIRTRSGATAHVGIEVRAGADDTIHLLLYGAGEDDESVQLVGATQVSPSGEVAAVETLPDPFSPADPGSPAHLVIAPGSSTPMLVYELTDGVHVYARFG